MCAPVYIRQYVCVYVCVCVCARALLRATEKGDQDHNKHETSTKSGGQKARVYLLPRTVWTDLTTVVNLPQHGHTPLTPRPALAHPEMTVTVDWALTMTYLPALACMEPTNQILHMTANTRGITPQ